MQPPLLLDLNFDSPQEQLACDEAMLDWADESDLHPGFLRFHESRSCFVVLGYGKKLAEETFEDRCAQRGIPILRRCSGGGTVLQGPGCFNYSLVLPIEAEPGLETITGANRAIMGRTRRAVERACGQAVEIRGITDLVLEGRKFSGNAQRRKRRCLLFHGAFLLHFDLPLISELLREPIQQPEYRERRDHSSFIRNLAAPSAALRRELCAEWNAAGEPDRATVMEVGSLCRRLAAGKYAQDEWNRRF